MNELSEEYALIREIGRQKKLSNMEQSTLLLDRLGIDYESKNNGIHLIVSHDTKIVDFYPSTGKWIVRKVGKSDRGVMNLLRYLGVK